MNTNDRWLSALDGATGKACAGFGRDGQVDTAADIQLDRPGGMQITSPPVVARGVVAVGSAGAVQAFDAVTGAPRWRFDPLASANPWIVAAAANVWPPISVDEARGLVFLPTTGLRPDFCGCLRKGDDRDADSVVALNIETGAKVWAFKTVHQDVWDYDNPVPPTLAMVAWQGVLLPTALQSTKQGLMVTLNRDSDRQVILVEEQPVPQAVAPAPSGIGLKDAFGLTPWDKAQCRRKIAGARHDGPFTPSSVGGMIEYPFTGGGSNRGGLAFDAARQVAFVNTARALHLITLIPADKVQAACRAEPDVEISPQAGAPFGMRREVMRSSLGLPCNPPPWGRLHTIDMRTGRIIWAARLGTTEDLAPGSQFVLPHAGAPNFCGSITTASG